MSTGSMATTTDATGRGGPGDDGDGADPGGSGGPGGSPVPPGNGQAESTVLAPAARSRRKRALDLGVSAAILPAVLLLGSIIALLVRATSRGPVFYIQDRVGLGGKHFRLVKFRTMQADADARLRSDPVLWEEYIRNDYKLPAAFDSRVTAVGRLLRRSSLDELPQLYNVLVGHMSLVGPRPIVPEELAMYDADPAAYLSVRPGVTGLWQVNGRSGIGYPERVGFDRTYADTWTIRLDLRILVRTPLTVVRGHGAF